jgi:hypothetical protein
MRLKLAPMGSSPRVTAVGRDRIDLDEVIGRHHVGASTRADAGSGGLNYFILLVCKHSSGAHFGDFGQSCKEGSADQDKS